MLADHLGVPTLNVMALHKVNKFAILNSAIEGEDGGYGNVNSRALATASLSTPAKTVAN